MNLTTLPLLARKTEAVYTTMQDQTDADAITATVAALHKDGYALTYPIRDL